MRIPILSLTANTRRILTVFAALLIGMVALLGFGTQSANSQTTTPLSKDIKEAKEFDVTFKEGGEKIPIHVREKKSPGSGRQVPVLLVHTTLGNSKTWDFQGNIGPNGEFQDRSVMNY